MFLLPGAREARRRGRRRGRRWPRCWAARSPPATSGTTVAILSGGNVDAGPARPRSPAATRPRPGGGWSCSRAARPARRARRAARARGRTGANIVDVSHVREGVDLHVRETAVELVLETRGREHAEDVLQQFGDAGYDAARRALSAAHGAARSTIRRSPRGARAWPRRRRAPSRARSASRIRACCSCACAARAGERGIALEQVGRARSGAAVIAATRRGERVASAIVRWKATSARR